MRNIDCTSGSCNSRLVGFKPSYMLGWTSLLKKCKILNPTLDLLGQNLCTEPKILYFYKAHQKMSIKPVCTLVFGNNYFYNKERENMENSYSIMQIKMERILNIIQYNFIASQIQKLRTREVKLFAQRKTWVPEYKYTWYVYICISVFLQLNVPFILNHWIRM